MMRRGVRRVINSEEKRDGTRKLRSIGQIDENLNENILIKIARVRVLSSFVHTPPS